MSESKSETIKNLQKKIFNSRFFTISLLLHVILVIILGGTVMFNKYTEQGDFTGGDGSGLLSNEVAQQAPPPPTQQQPTFTVKTEASTPSLSAITTSAPATTAFAIPQVMNPTVVNQVTTASAPVTPVNPTMTSANAIPKDIARGIKGFTGGWSKGGNGGMGSSLKAREFEFTAYLAKYANGDWNSTVKLDAGSIIGGSLPNLLYVMGKLSKDRIKANAQAIPLDLANDEIFAKKPPFIFFTGHRDFVLTDKEVENLQKYLRLGGCIWGDSSVPGRRSRFDLAFRREMRRVVPDKDKDFEELPNNHDIFTKTYYQEIKSVVPGINFYHESVYALKVYGEIAVLYTANDYGDMWQFGLNEKGEFDTRRDIKNVMVAMNEGMYWNSSNYYGNINPQAVFLTYKFGTNIIVHLVTRWEDKVRSVSSSL